MIFSQSHAGKPGVRIALLLIGLVSGLTGGFPAIAQPLRVTITPGAGHDRFTESFFLDDTTSISVDSLTQIRRTIDDLRESYGSLGIDLQRNRWRLESTTYATDAAWRNISHGQGRIQRGAWRVDLRGRLEWKGTDPADSLTSAYTYTHLDIKPRYEINRWWSALVRGDWEHVVYRQRSPFTYGYGRTRGQVGLAYFGEGFQSFDAWLGVSHRRVPDSSLLAYTERFVRLEGSGWRTGRIRWSADFAFADREFDPANSEDSHRRWQADTRFDVNWNRTWRMSGAAEWQFWNYRQESDANYDVANWRILAEVRARAGDAVEIGGDLEWRLERPTQADFTDNKYSQWAVGPVVLWTPSPAISAELAPRIGFRGYGAASLIYDDYSFWEIDLQTDIYPARGPNFAFTLTYLSETHDDRSRDIDELYLSVALRLPLQL